MLDLMEAQYVETGPNAGLQVGPPKDRARIEAKVLEYADESTKDPDGFPDTQCVAKYVSDWLRCRVVFSNPQTLAVFFWYLIFKVPELRVIRSKNKLVIP